MVIGRAINVELSSHELNKTWTIVKRSQKKNIVVCKWV